MSLMAIVFVFVVCGPGDVDALHINGSAKMMWGIADLCAFAALFAPHRMMARPIREGWILLSWPLLATASCLWSSSPFTSFDHGIQLLLTILIGFMTASLASLRQILLWLVIGLGLAGLASLTLVIVTPWASIGDDGTWIGAFTHKNQLGGFMVLELITATALIIDGHHRRIAVLCVPAALLLVFGSKSGTSLLAIAAALTPLPLAWAHRRGPATVGLLLGALLCGSAVCLALLFGDHADLVGHILDGLGKDSTLTGRTILWQFGLDQIGQTPIIGLGYKAYWESAATSAEYLRYVIGQRLWFFHNNFIDVGVAFGVIGLVVFSAGLLFAFYRVVKIIAQEPTALNIWRLMFMLFVSIEATAENPLFQNHSLLQLLMALAVTRCSNGGDLRPAPIPGRAIELRSRDRG